MLVSSVPGDFAATNMTRMDLGAPGALVRARFVTGDQRWRQV
jgi:hypothetical protein